MNRDERMLRAAADFVERSAAHGYTYNFTWLGVPVIQYPQDLVALQELVWRVRPDLIIETGVAYGGSAIFFASLLEQLGAGRVLAIDVDIRAHNRRAIEAHPLAERIDLVEGSSTDPHVVEIAQRAAAGRRAFVSLDSNHSHEHVLRELELYSPLVRRGSYLVVFDTLVEQLPGDVPDRPWGKGDNPLTAVREFLKHNDRFEIDREIQSRLLVTSAPDGYLRCVKD